jgi:protein tyrosine phosphatase domain-containing protein 1
LTDYGGKNAIDGLFSNWITDNILAHQRPSSRLISEFDLINVFKSVGICAIFNLQCSGEHANCGDGNDPATGFSYNPKTFMDSGSIFLF